MLQGAGFMAVWEQFLYIAIFAAVTLGVSIAPHAETERLR